VNRTIEGQEKKCSFIQKKKREGGGKQKEGKKRKPVGDKKERGKKREKKNRLFGRD